MIPSPLYKAVEGGGTQPRVLRLGDAKVEGGEVVALFVDLLLGYDITELQSFKVPDTWAGASKYAYLLVFLENYKFKCEELKEQLCRDMGKAVAAKRLGAVWGLLFGGIAQDVDLMIVSLQNGNVNDIWGTKENALATDGLTAAQGQALLNIDAANGGEAILLGANRLDPGSWSKEMRDLVNPDIFLTLCSAWGKVEKDLFDLEGLAQMSPTVVDSPSPSLFVRTSGRHNLLSHGGESYFRSRLAELTWGEGCECKEEDAEEKDYDAEEKAADGEDVKDEEDKEDKVAKLADAASHVATDGTGLTSHYNRTFPTAEPSEAVWQKYSEEFNVALAEIGHASIDENLKDRMRRIFGYGVIQRSKMNELL